MNLGNPGYLGLTPQAIQISPLQGEGGDKPLPYEQNGTFLSEPYWNRTPYRRAPAFRRSRNASNSSLTAGKPPSGKLSGLSQNSASAPVPQRS
jgi:hypothetical protein